MPNQLKKLILVFVVAGVYFIIVREVRKSFVSIQIEKVLEFQGTSSITKIEQAPVSITFILDGSHMRLYKISFGMFFLFACIGLVLVDSKKKDYLILFLIHMIGGLLSTIFMWVGINSSTSLLVIPDALSRYFIPLCSLGLVALVYIQNKNKNIYEN